MPDDFNPANKNWFSRCVVPGCDRPHSQNHRLCATHQSRLVRHGSVHAVEAPGRKPKLTVAQCAEIKRLDHNFVARNEIARRVDTSTVIVRKVLKGTYIPREDAPDA